MVHLVVGQEVQTTVLLAHVVVVHQDQLQEDGDEEELGILAEAEQLAEFMIIGDWVHIGMEGIVTGMVEYDYLFHDEVDGVEEVDQEHEVHREVDVAIEHQVRQEDRHVHGRTLLHLVIHALGHQNQ